MGYTSVDPLMTSREEWGIKRCIDELSRQMSCLEACKTNNDPQIIMGVLLQSPMHSLTELWNWKTAVHYNDEVLYDTLNKDMSFEV